SGFDDPKKSARRWPHWRYWRFSLPCLGVPPRAPAGAGRSFSFFSPWGLQHLLRSRGHCFRCCFLLCGWGPCPLCLFKSPPSPIALGFLIIAFPVRPETMAPWIGVAYVFALFGGCILVDRLYDVPVRQFLGRVREARLDPKPVG